MQLQSLIVVILRLYAVYWLAISIADMSEQLVTLYFRTEENLGSYGDFLFGAVAVAMFLIFLVLWCLANWISTRVTKGHTVHLATAPLTLEDLCRLAFIILGLYFLLSSITRLTETGYRFFVYDFNLPATDDLKGRELVSFTGSLLTAIAGATCILGAKTWTKMVLQTGREPQSQHSEPPSA